MWFTVVLALGIVGGGITAIVVPIVRERRQLRAHRAHQRAVNADARAEILDNLGAAIAEAIAEDGAAPRPLASSPSPPTPTDPVRPMLQPCPERDDTGSSIWCNSDASAGSSSSGSSGSSWSWDDD